MNEAGTARFGNEDAKNSRGESSSSYARNQSETGALTRRPGFIWCARESAATQCSAGRIEINCSCAGQSGSKSQYLQWNPGLAAKSCARILSATSAMICFVFASAFASLVVATASFVVRL